MGFFSKIKKMWGKNKNLEESAASEQPAASPATAESTSEETAIQQGSASAEKKTLAEPAPQALKEDWQQDLVQALQQAEPKLSTWLDLILQDVHTSGPKLRQRLYFLFENLEVPEDEAEDFINRFEEWLEDMDYERVEEFRSELQYRLALALDLEDEEDERSRLFLKLSNGLNKTKEQLSKQVDQLLSKSKSFDESFWEELEEILIMADVGFKATHELVQRMRNKVRQAEAEAPEQFKELFREELANIFPAPKVKIKPSPPEVVLMIGVNGVGKTTTIAKLAHRAHMQGRKTLVAAGDTFRAAAIEQLEIWASRVGAGFYAKKANSDPAAVAYEALEKAKQENYDLVFVDTAGRLHTKVDLMDELRKIKRVLSKRHPGAPHRTILVLDATTGQNALSQTKLFAEGVDIDEIILTKLDGTAKGGVVLAIALEYNLPITFIGLGEKMEDLRPFSGQDFAQALLE
jgi:fused signal recognition particle receptor